MYFKQPNLKITFANKRDFETCSDCCKNTAAVSLKVALTYAYSNKLICIVLLN